MKKYSLPLLLGWLLTTGLGSHPAVAGTLFTLEHPGNTTYDPNTGLEWLDLSLTAGQSYSSVLNGWNGYTTTQGFRFATRNEVLRLFTDAGATGANSIWSQSDAAAARHLLSLAGTTLALTELDRSWMFYDPATEPSLPTSAYASSAVFGIWRAPSGDEGVFSVPGLFPLRDYASPEMASALVRMVPEPSPAMLLTAYFGLTLFAVKRAKR